MKDDNEDNVDMESHGTYNVKASAYFDDLRFFRQDRGREFFHGKVLDWQIIEDEPDILDLRDITVDEFYTKAWKLSKNKGDLKAFVGENISSCRAQAVLEDFNKWKEATGFGDLDANENSTGTGTGNEGQANRKTSPENLPTAKKAKVESENVDMESPGAYDVKASDYFNDIRFFNGVETRKTGFNKTLQDYKNEENDPKILDLRHMKVDEFYNKAWQLWKNDDEDPEKFFLYYIYKCDAKAVLQDFNEWKEATGVGDLDANIRRMVGVGYKIQDTILSHNFDLDSFSTRIEELFQWQGKKKTEKKLVGPYLCFVQSSGMGKTKLMYEYKKNAANHGVGAFLILATVIESEKEGVTGVFDEQWDLKEEVIDRVDKSEKNASKLAAEKIYEKLDKTLDVPNSKIVLLFDESHFLLQQHFGYEAFLFRCIRVWLRQVRVEKQVVAVFAGTNSRLSNFLVETDNQFGLRHSPSRDHQMSNAEYSDKGEIPNPPFYGTTTMGSCLASLPHIDPDSSEYARAVYYGRPLFAVMAKEGVLDGKISTVLARMLLLEEKAMQWGENRNALINLLSTRVQMGQTTMAVTSDLVAKGYANLSGYFEETVAAQLAYLPDPVCARLAMCMMDEDFICELPTSRNVAKGMDKQWWTEKLKEIYSSGIVSPEKGDFGEVVVALYMLFCADVLRKRTNSAYIHFSVSLDEWLHLLQSGGKVPEATSDHGNACKVSIGFIQVCRNSLRSYRVSWKSLAKRNFLEHVYESGTAFYSYQGCPLIDLVIPLRVKTDQKVEFVPMLVSIKCHSSFSKQKEEDVLRDMMARAHEDKLEKALCLLIVFGSNPTAKDNLTVEEASNELTTSNNCVLSRVIRVPQDDVFGLTQAFKAMTPIAQMNAELLASHPYIMAHGSDEASELRVDEAMRSATPKPLQAKYNALRTAMSGIKTDQNESQP